MLSAPRRARVVLTGFLVLAAVVGAACAGRTRNAQVLTGPVDSCVTARENAAANPRLEVERVPTPVRMQPAPLPRNIPRTALRRDGSAVVRIEVLVDTLGKADTATFSVIESTSATLTNSAKRAIAQWEFEPALLYGCKVARFYQFSASKPPTTRR